MLLAACLGSPGGCSAEEAAAFNAISHYGNEELVPGPHPYGVCADSLVTSDEPDAVIEHYRAAFEAAGYTIGGVESSPITDERGATVGRAVFLQASNGSMTASVSAEVFGGQKTTFNVLVGDAQ
ncbi:MAG: hypothetical protein M3R05_07025 [Chloroflexota bacterium]|nr:hypothetical protein [Chloroflexota bacterium]